MRTWSEDHPKARLLERKQGAIKEAAKDLFLKHGYASTKMEMIAAQANVSIMTLYRHFRSKDVLFVAVMEHLCNKKVSDITDAIWQGSPAEVLHQLGRKRLTFLLNPEEIALYRVVIGAMEHFPEVGNAYYHLHFEAPPVRLATYFKEIHQQGILSIPDPLLSARTFLILLQGQLIEQARLGATPPLTNEDIERHLDNSVAFFLAMHQSPTPA